ncbi:mechanosensitive ion channel family protein [Roseibium marinum]|uniref:Small-conductance mechanosensitive channel n=1 Tax=Roseibium marinum TaxID=281252 RepID=A0A2S3UYV6_9HYPH|nr:mechanosensitive ion channel family protein [Roseibium marinum]POF32790.1 small-conductance mechanosensitive channel [Roseibium marinum]
MLSEKAFSTGRVETTAVGKLLMLAVVACCLTAVPQRAAAQSETQPATIAAETNASDDRAIQRRIHGIFEELEGLEKITVSVKSGVVTLQGTVAETPLANQARELAGRVDGVVAIRNELREETALEERLVPAYERLQARAFQALNYIPLVLVSGVLWFLVSFAGYLVAGLQWPWNRLAPNAFIADLLRQIIRILFFVIGIVLALDVLGATAVIGTLLGAAGIVGLAVGFAVRDTVENYIASIMLSIRQPFSPKDFVKIENFEGIVIRLTSRATILMEMDGNHIRIPNAIVFKSTIINYTVNPQRRFTFELGVDAESELDKALQIGLETIALQDFVLKDPSPDAWIDRVGDSNVLLIFAGWIDQNKTDFLRARSEAMRLVKQALETNGFSLPEPIYRLRFDSDVFVPRPGEDAEKRTAPRRAQQAKKQRTAKMGKAKDTGADKDLEKRIDEERMTSGSEDLLDDTAPKEFGSNSPQS